MPCNSEHMNPTTYERDLSRVACLLDELAGKKWEPSWWDGYHPRVYCKADRSMGDQMPLFAWHNKYYPEPSSHPHHPWCVLGASLIPDRNDSVRAALAKENSND